MTRDEILALEGPALAVAVAERVMGERIMAIPRVGYVIAPVDGSWKSLPRYPEDIAAAWQVVERMREMGLRPIIVSDWNEQWLCEVYRKSEWVAQSRWYNSAPRAICEAALLAVMGEGEV